MTVIEIPDESVVEFPVRGMRIAGYLHRPKGRSGRRPAMVFLHGFAGYSIGPNALLIDLARALASRGHPVLRFDFRGRGLSHGEAKDAGSESMTEDALAAYDYLKTALGEVPIVMLGLCSGASVASALVDVLTPAGLALVSPDLPPGSEAPVGIVRGTQLRSAFGSLAAAFRLRNWRRVLTGELRSRESIFLWRERLWRIVREGFARRDSRTEGPGAASCGACQRAYSGDVLLVTPSDDPEGPFIQEGIRRSFPRASFVGVCVEGADHNFYSVRARSRLHAVIEDWLDSICV